MRTRTSLIRTTPMVSTIIGELGSAIHSLMAANDKIIYFIQSCLGISRYYFFINFIL